MIIIIPASIYIYIVLILTRGRTPLLKRMGEGLGLQKIIKAIPSKALVIRINLVFLAFFLIIYASLLLRPSSSVYFENAASLVRCSLRECHHKVR